MFSHTVPLLYFLIFAFTLLKGLMHVSHGYFTYTVFLRVSRI